MKRKDVVKPREIQTAREQQIGEGVDLGMWLGRRQAFALVAGRCSAADAECIREVRRNKRYRALQMTWEQFCEERLGITCMTANKIVRQLEEFGPEFFTLAQLTRVTPEEYRRLNVAVRGHALLHAGEEIPIDAENGPRLAAAIEELRRNAKAEPPVVVELVAETTDVSGEQIPGSAPGHAPGHADLQIDTSEQVNREIGGSGNAHPAFGAPTPREPGEATAEPDESPNDQPSDTMTEAERVLSRAEQSLYPMLRELERLRLADMDMGDRLRLHTLVGSGAHRFNMLQLSVRF